MTVCHCLGQPSGCFDRFGSKKIYWPVKISSTLLLSKHVSLLHFIKYMYVTRLIKCAVHFKKLEMVVLTTCATIKSTRPGLKKLILIIVRVVEWH